MAAFIQQKFDTYVYTMPWNRRIFGDDKNVSSEIAQYSEKILSNNAEKEKLKNWYTVEADRKPLNEGRIAFWAPMLQWLFETVKMLNDDLENLNELDVAINSKEEKSMEDLQDIQKLIYEHRKGCLTIPNFFYGYFKDNDEDRAHRMANM